jgi:hypothetical protein
MIQRTDIHDQVQSFRRDHAMWLEQFARWHDEHRQTLLLLSKVQTAILERDGDLATLAEKIRNHDRELHEYELMGTEAFTPDPEVELRKHSEFVEVHETARQQFQQAERLHNNLVAAAEKLFRSCES